jgi:hypothetical protein
MMIAQLVSADHQRFDDVLQDGLIGKGETAGPEHLADSNEALVRVYFQQMSRPFIVVTLREAKFFVHVMLQND